MSGPRFVHGFLGAAAQRSPGHTALIADGRKTTFETLHRNSSTLSAALQDRGVQKGDRVALLMDNSIEMVTAMFAAMMAGAVCVLIHWTTKAEKLRYLLIDCGALAVIAPGLAGPAIGEVASEVTGVGTWILAGEAVGGDFISVEEILSGPARVPRDPGLGDEDLCSILYTSGSTGEPKGVMLTHRNMASTTSSIASYLGNVPGDVVMCVLPLSFGYGLSQVLTGALVGFTVVLDKSFAFRAEVLRHLEEYRVTGLPGVPSMYASLIQMERFNGRELPGLRYMTNAAASISPAHILRLGELFPAAKFFSMYGQTECTRVCFLHPERIKDKVSSVGKAISNCEAYIVDEYGGRVGPGVVGELVVRGANVMKGYWGRPVESAQRVRLDAQTGERVLYTGDQFRTDDEGFLYFVGRSDDVFKCRGEKVSPKEIENVLYDLAGVAAAAVVGVDDPADGKAIKLCVVPVQGAALSEVDIRRHCKERLEAHLQPKFVEIRDSLPMTESGKIKKSGLALASPA